MAAEEATVASRRKQARHARHLLQRVRQYAEELDQKGEGNTRISTRAHKRNDKELSLLSRRLVKLAGKFVAQCTPQLGFAFNTRCDPAEGKGVTVTSLMPGRAADHAGMRVGDVLCRVEDTPVSSAADLTAVVKKTFHAGQWKTLTVCRAVRQGHVAWDAASPANATEQISLRMLVAAKTVPMPVLDTLVEIAGGRVHDDDLGNVHLLMIGFFKKE